MTRRRGASTVEEEEIERDRITVSLPASTVDRARDAVFWTPGATMATLLDEAILREIARLEKKRGEPFPARKGPIRTGRPVRT